MAAWVLTRALDVVRLLAGHHRGELWDRLDLRDDELTRWRRLAAAWPCRHTPTA